MTGERGQVTGERVAIKVARVGSEDILRHESKVMTAVDGTEQIPRLHGLGKIQEEPTKTAMVMELVSGRQLTATELTRRDPTKAVRITMQILRALRRLHAAGYRHGDLHRNQVLIEDDRSASVKVLDLGFSWERNAPYPWGGPGYYAPEQTAKQPSLGRVNGDIYSAGAILLHLVTGLDPSQDVISHLPDLDRGSTRLRHVVARAMDPNPATRYQSAQEMLDALRPLSPGL